MGSVKACQSEWSSGCYAVTVSSVWACDCTEVTDTSDVLFIVFYADFFFGVWLHKFVGVTF